MTTPLMTAAQEMLKLLRYFRDELENEIPTAEWNRLLEVIALAEPVVPLIHIGYGPMTNTTWLADVGDFNVTEDKTKAHCFASMSDAIRTVKRFLNHDRPWFIEQDAHVVYGIEAVQGFIRQEQADEAKARQS